MGDDGPRPARDRDLAELRRHFWALARMVHGMEARLAALEKLAVLSAREIDDEISEALDSPTADLGAWR